MASLPCASRVLATPSLAAAPASTRDIVAQFPTLTMAEEGILCCLRLPELLARALDRYLVVAWDEFQELILGASEGQLDG